MRNTMLLTGSGPIDAERAFTHEMRARRRDAVLRRVRRQCAELDRLDVLDLRGRRRPGVAAIAGRGVREIPLTAIRGTLEPSRANLFDSRFRPAAAARGRWQRVWLAAQRGAPLPPIDVVAVEDGYAVRDGHHRVSVAKARGALTIDAVVDGAV
jgi:hypothetical protein